MKHFFIQLLPAILFTLLTVMAYSQVEEYNYSAKGNIPEWANLMYSENPDPEVVQMAYEQYYQDRIFIKNQHTQYYKRWMRHLTRNQVPTHSVDALNQYRNDLKQYLQRTEAGQSNRSPNSSWECLGPFDFDKDAESRSYAPGAAHVYTVEQSLSNANVLYAGTATAGIWKSIDKGLNWTLTTSDLMVNGLRSLAIDPTNENIVYAGILGGVYRSENGGDSWSEIGDATFQDFNHSVNDLVFEPGNSMVLYVASNQGLFRSNNGGGSFTMIMDATFQEIEFHPTNPAVVYAVRQVYDRTEFYRSTDGGLTFTLSVNGWPGIQNTQSFTFNGLQFTGSNFLAFANNPALGSGFGLQDFTIELMVRSNGWSGNPSIMANKNRSNNNNPGFAFIARSNGEWRFRMGDGLSNIELNGKRLDDDKWHHLAITYSASGLKKLYHDGTLVDSTSQVLAAGTASGLTMALAQDGTLTDSDFFNGTIGAVRIWTEELGQQTLRDWQCRYVNFTHPQIGDLLHSWNFTEGSGNAVGDSNGTNHGTVNGFPTWSLNNNPICVISDFDGIDHQRRTEIATTPAAPGMIVALATGSVPPYSGTYGIYVSHDSGLTWSRTCCGPSPVGAPDENTNPNLMGWSDVGSDDGGQYYYDLALDISDTDSNRIHVGGVNHWVSTDGGITFTCPAKWSHPHKPNYVHADIHDIRYFGNDLWMACDGGIFYSNDEGLNIVRRMNGIAGTDFWGFGAAFWDGGVMLGGTYHNGTLLKDNNTYINGWLSTDGGDNYRGFANFGRDRQVFSDYNKKILSGDRSVPIQTFGYNKKPNASYITGESSEIVYDPRCFNILYSGNENGLWKSYDDGINYDLVHDFGEKVTAIEVGWDNPDVLYVATFASWWGTKKVYRSTDAGTTWIDITPSNTLLNGNTWVPYDIAVSGTDANTLWLVRTSQYGSTNLNGNMVFKSTNAGDNWTNLSTATLNGEAPTNIVHIRGSEGGVYIGTRRAVYYRNDNMADWVLFNTDLPVTTHSTRLVPFYREGKLRNGTNRSVYQVDLYEDSPPVAQIAADRRESFCPRDTIQFVDHSALRETVNTTWLWTFPGGNPATSTERNPKVVYSSAGSYDVSLTVSDDFGTDTQTLSNFLNISGECLPDTIPGLALQCTVSGDYANIPDLGINTNTMTVTAWVKPNGIQNEYTGIVMNDGDAAGFNFRENNNTLGYHWPGGAWWWDSNLTVPADEWSYVAMVATPTSMTVYVNGIASTHNTNLTPTDISTMKIGSYKGWGSRNFNGLIDEVVIWDRALSQDEIREQRHLTKMPVNDPDILAYYQFNRPSGQITDRARLFHATLNGNAGRTTSTGPFAGGVAHRMLVNTGGIKSFTGTGLTLAFNDIAVLPDGELVASRLHIEPDVLPNAFPHTDHYWIINNYGNNANFSELAYIQFEDAGEVTFDDISQPSTFKLYKRSDNADGPTWGGFVDEGDLAVAGTPGDIQFNSGNGITSFSQFIITNHGGTSLPIELLGFEAWVGQQKWVQLEWITETRKEHDYFEIERSRNGVDFEFLLTENPETAESLIRETFAAIDKNPWKGTSYYRLKSVDLDGEITFSEIRSVYIPMQDIQIYPNPIRTGDLLTIERPDESTLDFTLFDVKGKEVFKKRGFQASSLEIPIDVPGVYFYQIITETNMHHGKLLIR